VWNDDDDGNEIMAEWIMMANDDGRMRRNDDGMMAE